MPEPQQTPTEYHDEYSETLGTEFRKLEDALLSDTVSLLASADPIRLDESTAAEVALETMLAQDRVAVLAIDPEGRLRGIATDRDLLKRAGAAGCDAAKTRLVDVMTAEPETVKPNDRICYALNRMIATGCRTVPLVDEEG